MSDFSSWESRRGRLLVPREFDKLATLAQRKRVLYACAVHALTRLSSDVGRSEALQLVNGYELMAPETAAERLARIREHPSPTVALKLARLVLMQLQPDALGLMTTLDDITQAVTDAGVDSQAEHSYQHLFVMNFQ